MGLARVDTRDVSVVAFQLNHRQIPLSESPRASKRVPLFPTLAPPAYLGDFTEATVAIVNLHGQGTYDLAKDLHGWGITLQVRRDLENAHDENAVGCYTKIKGNFDLVGYLCREDAAVIAPELDAGATLKGHLLGPPWSGSNSRGGSVGLTVYLAE